MSATRLQRRCVDPEDAASSIVLGRPTQLDGDRLPVLDDSDHETDSQCSESHRQ